MSISQKPQHIILFFHKRNKQALLWDKRIKKWLKNKFPSVSVGKIDGGSDAIVVFGGDGTILEAARKFHKFNPIIIGLNLGTVGFLASVRDESNFLKSLENFFRGRYKVVERMMIMAEVRRKNKVIFSGDALNEIVIKNPIGIVELSAEIEGHPVQNIRGTGILIATATGSTAYNLSAHGPIVMPDIKCLIITELLDHGIPTPSVIVKYHNSIAIKLVSYKKRGILSLTKTGQKVDVILSADGESVFPLEVGDEIIVRSSLHLVRFAELEKNYFFKSLEEKFGFE